MSYHGHKYSCPAPAYKCTCDEEKVREQERKNTQMCLASASRIIEEQKKEIRQLRAALNQIRIVAETNGRKTIAVMCKKALGGK